MEALPWQEKIESAHRAAEQGDIRDVQSQLDRRKLAGSTLKDGATPLHRAAFMGHSSECGDSTGRVIGRRAEAPGLGGGATGLSTK